MSPGISHSVMSIKSKTLPETQQSYPSYALLQVVLCQINIFCHQLTQNTTTDFVRHTKIYTNFSEIQNTSFASFEFQNNLCKSDKVSLYTWWQKVLIWQRIASKFLNWPILDPHFPLFFWKMKKKYFEIF